jgi:hypothetical protein
MPATLVNRRTEISRVALADNARLDRCSKLKPVVSTLWRLGLHGRIIPDRRQPEQGILDDHSRLVGAVLVYD